MKVTKKRRNAIDERYNSIMNVLARKVKRIIENCDNCDEDEFDECDRFNECGDDEEFDECDTFECNENFRRNRMRRSSRLYEMAKTVIDRKILANVRDKISRNGWDSPYGINWRKVVSLPRNFTPDELLQYYVAALLLYGEDCPQTEADIDSIGVFTNYAHKLLDEYGYTIDDIKDFYAQNEKIQSKSRRGSSRGSKAYRATKDNPSPDMDFDTEEDEQEQVQTSSSFQDNIPSADMDNDYTDEKQHDENGNYEEETPEDNEPENNDYPAYDEVETEAPVEDEPVEDEEDDDVPAENYEDVPVDEPEDEEEPAEENDFPDYDDVDTSDESDDDGYEEVVDDSDSDDDGYEEIADDDDDDDGYEEIVDDSDDDSYEETDEPSVSSNKKDYPDYDEVDDDDSYEEIVDDEGLFDKGSDDEEEREASDFAHYDDIDTDTVLDIEDEDKKPSEYTFEDIMNPNFNEVVHNYNPDKFKLDKDGNIGFDVYRYKTIEEANNNSIPFATRKPTFTIWDKNVAFALVKLRYLVSEDTKTFGECDPQVRSLIKVIMHYQPEFKDLCDKYDNKIDELKRTDTWFLNHKNRISTGDIKVVGDDKEVEKTVLDFFNHVEKECPISSLVDAELDFDKKFNDVSNIIDDEDEDVANFKKTRP